MEQETTTPPENEIIDVNDFLEDYFKGTEFKELINSEIDTPARKLSDLSPELVSELRSSGVSSEEYLDFLKLRDKLANSSSGISVTTHIATSGLSNKVAKLLLDGSVAKKIQDYSDQVIHTDFNLKNEIKDLDKDEAKDRVKYHDSLRRDLHNKAAQSLTRKWYTSPSLNLSGHLVAYLNDQGGNGLIELGRPIVSIIAEEKIARTIGNSV